MTSPETLEARIASFFSRFPSVEFAPGTPVLEATEHPETTFYIKDGYVRQYIISPDGVELTVHLFRSGSFFPLMQVLNDTPNRFFYEAFTPIVMHMASAVDVRQFLKSEPEVLYDLTQRLLLGIDGLLVRLEVVAFGSAALRVADGLIFLVRHFGTIEGNSVKIDQRLTHRHIAQIVGLTRETTSLELERLMKQGILSKDGDRLVILDHQRLSQAATLG
jgi:CRP/FNR family cyclic AMP-dependent transcriptional regulator